VSVQSSAALAAQAEVSGKSGELIEVRWHGRGGQGAKTAALLLGEAASGAGKYVQAFPEYGPERMGAPVVAYNRLSDEPIMLHCSIESPKYVVVLDTTLSGQVDFTAGIPDGGVLIVNAAWTPAEAREKLGVKNPSIKVFTVDASSIAQETIGRPIPNTPMLGALDRVVGLLDLDELLVSVRQKLEKKFRNRPEIIDGNVEAVRRAYLEVQGE
jgi:pyruvate ferredoxin oxidoreductase gamma subunit